MNASMKLIGFASLLLMISNLTQGKTESRLRVGKAINVFVRYGYLGISMKVISYNDTERWLFKEPTNNVFVVSVWLYCLFVFSLICLVWQRLTACFVTVRGAQGVEDLVETTEENQPGVFHGDFHMEFCDNRRQLLQAYFRDFTIERLEHPWKAFAGGWQDEVAARKLGINSSFIKGDYCYVLVRVSRFRETARMTKPIPANQVLYEDVSRQIHNMTPGDAANTVQLMSNYGTHYINSYVTGNSLYQVSEVGSRERATRREARQMMMIINLCDSLSFANRSFSSLFFLIVRSLR